MVYRLWRRVRKPRRWLSPGLSAAAASAMLLLRMVAVAERLLLLVERVAEVDELLVIVPLAAVVRAYLAALPCTVTAINRIPIPTEAVAVHVGPVVVPPPLLARAVPAGVVLAVRFRLVAVGPSRGLRVEVVAVVADSLIGGDVAAYPVLAESCF